MYVYHLGCRPLASSSSIQTRHAYYYGADELSLLHRQSARQSNFPIRILGWILIVISSVLSSRTMLEKSNNWMEEDKESDLIPLVH